MCGRCYALKQNRKVSCACNSCLPGVVAGERRGVCFMPQSTSLVCYCLVGYYPGTAGLASPLLHNDFPLPCQLFFQPSTQLSFFHMYYWCHFNFGQHIYQYNTPVLMSDRLYKSISTVLQNILHWLSAVCFVCFVCLKTFTLEQNQDKMKLRLLNWSAF